MLLPLAWPSLGSRARRRASAAIVTSWARRSTRKGDMRGRGAAMPSREDKGRRLRTRRLPSRRNAVSGLGVFGRGSLGGRGRVRCIGRWLAAVQHHCVHRV